MIVAGHPISIARFQRETVFKGCPFLLPLRTLHGQEPATRLQGRLEEGTKPLEGGDGPDQYACSPGGKGRLLSPLFENGDLGEGQGVNGLLEKAHPLTQRFNQHEGAFRGQGSQYESRQPCARTNVVEHARFRQGGEHRCAVQKMAFHEGFPILGPGKIEGSGPALMERKPLPQPIDCAAIMGHRQLRETCLEAGLESPVDR